MAFRRLFYELPYFFSVRKIDSKKLGIMIKHYFLRGKMLPKPRNRIVLNDRKIKVSEVVDMIKISTKRIYHISYENMGMEKLSARWLPRSLTID